MVAERDTSNVFVVFTRGYVMCFFLQAEDGIRDVAVTEVQTCALPILLLFVGDARGLLRPAVGRARRRDGGRVPIPERRAVPVPVRLPGYAESRLRTDERGERVRRGASPRVKPPACWSTSGEPPTPPRTPPPAPSGTPSSARRPRNPRPVSTARRRSRRRRRPSRDP